MSTLNPLLPLLFSLFALLKDVFVQGQALPTDASEMAFARIGSRLYIQGGRRMTSRTVLTPISQFISFDLSTSWPVTSPSWKAHANAGAPSIHLTAGTGSADNQTFFVYKADQISFSIHRIDVNDPNSTWAVATLEHPDIFSAAIRPVLDSRTGRVYIAGVNSMNVFDLTKYNWLPSTPANSPTLGYGGAVYNGARNSIMYHGGYHGEWQQGTTAFLTEYFIDLSRWSTFLTNGDIPGIRSDHCMAITEDNSKIVIFGGRVPLAPNSTSSSESTFSEELFVLDIATSSWKKGPNAAIKRGYTACIIVGDQFLAWGGYNDNLVVSGPPIVFDLTKFEWANTYTAPIYNQTHQTQTQTITGSQTPSSTQSQPTQTGEPSATNKEAIIGGSVGALALIVIIAGLIIYKRWRRGKSQGYSVPEEKGFNQYDDSCAPEYLRNSMTEHVYYNSNPTRGPQLMTRRNPQEMTPMTLYQGQIPQESFVANVTHGTQL